jgi:aspartate aminotransferase
MFRNVPPGPPDPVYTLKLRVDSDTSPAKIDLGVGVYRNEQGQYHELEAITRAKKVLDELQLGHDYEVTTGNATFVKNAAEVLFGRNADTTKSGSVSSKMQGQNNS